MFALLWLIPALPLTGFLVLVLRGSRLSRAGIAWTGVGSVGLSALVTLGVGAAFLSAPPPGGAYTQTLWTWVRVGDFAPAVAFSLDALSLTMALVVTGVGFLIHLYSAEHMQDDPDGYGRFFAYMNLFVAMMLVLVLADDLLVLYLGWEGVGLCSYLLIGFWYPDPKNGAAAMKAFIVTRVGDVALGIGLFLLVTELGTLAIQPLMQRAVVAWPVGSAPAVAAAALILGGALGKSAQVPLQTWLPDAMAGPSPVSALIHAATMVTAGVYLIARTHILFSLAPGVQATVAVIGAVTLVLASLSALAQWDIKRVLAYSTISQLGYMFLALGVGAWSAAIFHLMTHAFFKALLFLGAGVVIQAMHEEHDMFQMGGLWRRLPVTFWTFLIAAGSLAALPLVTAGFYSKDLILWETFASRHGSIWLWAAGTAGALLTGVYTFRMVFLTFFGEARRPVTRRPAWRVQLPLIVLAVLSVVGGLVEVPEPLGGRPYFSEFLHSALPAVPLASVSARTELLLEVAAALASLAGLLIASVLFLRRSDAVLRWTQARWAAVLHRVWLAGWGFDRLYDRAVVRPYAGLAQAGREDVVDLVYRGIAWLTRLGWRLLSRTETGRIRWYAAGVAGGAVILVVIVVAL